MTDKRKSHLSLSFCEAHLFHGILNFLFILFSWDFKHVSLKFWMPNAMHGVTSQYLLPTMFHSVKIYLFYSIISRLKMLL